MGYFIYTSNDPVRLAKSINRELNGKRAAHLVGGVAVSNGEYSQAIMFPEEDYMTGSLRSNSPMSPMAGGKRRKTMRRRRKI